MARPLTIGVVHTAASPCRCHASLVPALRRMGHRAFAADADALPGGLPRLARADVVFEQTDTFRGEGYLRPYVRAELERAGARVVGADAAASAVADDKAAARERLAAAGVPVAPGVAVRTLADRLPSRLRPPFVVKGAFEHGSRGLVVARSRAEALRAARAWVRRGAVAVVEELVEGTEVTVSLVGPRLRPLPPVAVGLPATKGAEGVLSFARKWTGFTGPGAPQGRLRAADLAPAAARRLLALARRAARALRMRDVVRFDVRRTPAGEFVFLEANARPSLERGADTATAAALDGMSYEELLAELIGARLARRGGRR